MSIYDKFNISRVNKVVSRELQDTTNTYDHSYNLQVGKPRHLLTETSRTSHDVMSTNNDSDSSHPEAYYLYFIAVFGIILNCVVVMAIFFRKPLRKMTSGFLIHACFLDFLKSAYCIPIGTNLLNQATPADCDFFGATFVILVTTSVFNMVAMVCTEAYTFGEKNIGGNSKGTAICITFGIVLVYIGSLILHLGPTLIGGHFEFQPEIGSCSFTFGKQTGYVAHIMWVVITSVAMIATYHFIHRLYKEIQINRPNRVSFLVRTSITVMDSSTTSTWKLRKIIRDATHRAHIFILNTVIFIICWYPFFFLVIIDKSFTVSPKVYQTFAFIAWSQGAIQPVLYICFDKNLNILAKYMKCVKTSNDIDKFFELLASRQKEADQSVPTFSDGEPSFNNTIDLPNNLNATRPRLTMPLPCSHQEMYAVQNSSNHTVHNRSMNIQNMEMVDLTNQLNSQSYSSPTQDPGSTENISETFSVNSENTLSTPSTGQVCDIYQNYNNDFPPPPDDELTEVEF